MSDKTDIEWCSTVQPDGTVTKGSTWNPVRGCVKVSPGCAHCYAETFAERFRGVPGHPYEQGFDLRLVPKKLSEPLSWKKPRRVFVNSMSDLFQDGVPDSYIDQVFAVMALTPQHTYQVLTKRADRMLAYLAPGQFRDVSVASVAQLFSKSVRPFALPSEAIFDARRVTRGEPWQINAWPLPNVWLGVSVENQHFADERIPLLLQTPAAVRFVSYEPALEYVNFRPWVGLLDWIIFGLESGSGARSGDADWGRDLIEACIGAKARPFIKQLGANGFDSARTASGRSEALRLHSKKGGDMSEWPADLRIRQFPTVPTGSTAT